MVLTPIQTMIIIVAIAVGTIITRFLPFVIFPEHKTPSHHLLYLGKALPPAMMGLLVVYCLKDINIMIAHHGLAELIAIIVIVILHKWRENVLLSIALGTIVYVVLINYLFV
ncbi:MAG: AzlD domain-containing protein [Erysipelotrichaceae bacterium]|nr:AzlD domain-containing protein [Erysipelotrichaceae bacterium]MDD4643392.1 AzlD domain-containing protein [Erysipelotrichaceae bacterium]